MVDSAPARSTTKYVFAVSAIRKPLFAISVFCIGVAHRTVPVATVVVDVTCTESLSPRPLPPEYLRVVFIAIVCEPAANSSVPPGKETDVVALCEVELIVIEPLCAFFATPSTSH